MTRETKLGLVVAGTFLALVGGVVTVRLRQADAPPADAEVAANQPLEPPTPTAPEPEKHDNPVPSSALAMADKNKMPPGTSPADVVPEPPAVVQPAAATVPAPQPEPPAPIPSP